MTRISKLIRQKGFRCLCAIAIPTIALAASACARFNIPYATNAPLAGFQSAMGIHSGGKMSDAEIIGHRGSALRNPRNLGKPIGNTKNAIQAGIDAGVDWIEIDLRRTSDGTLVLFHDESIQADTNADDGKVADLTLESLLRSEVSVDPPERVLTLEEFGQTFAKPMAAGGIGLILDLKVWGIKSQVLDWIASSGLDPSNVIIFGKYEILTEYRESGFKLGYTYTWKGDGNRIRYLFRQSEIVSRLSELNASYLVIPIIFCRESLAKEAEKNGISTWAYGSDDPRDWEKVRKLGVTGLILDHPKEAVELR